MHCRGHGHGHTGMHSFPAVPKLHSGPSPLHRQTRIAQFIPLPVLKRDTPVKVAPFETGMILPFLMQHQQKRLVHDSGISFQKRAEVKWFSSFHLIKGLLQFAGKRTMVFPRISIGLQDTLFRPQVLTGKITEVTVSAEDEPP